MTAGKKTLTEAPDDFRARMYGVRDDEPAPVSNGAPVPPKPGGVMNMLAMSREFWTLKRTVEDQERTIRRLENRLRRIEQHSNNLTRNLNALDGEVAMKVDRRGD